MSGDPRLGRHRRAINLAWMPTQAPASSQAVVAPPISWPKRNRKAGTLSVEDLNPLNYAQDEPLTISDIPRSMNSKSFLGCV